MGLGLEPLTAAYGRSYNSLKKAQEDFDKGLDFKTASGQYCSKSDIQTKEIRIRYGKNLSKTGFLTNK